MIGFIRYGLILSVCLLWGCVSTEKITDGPTAYERKRYAQAIQFLLPEYESARTKDQKGRLAYFLGDSYDHIGYYSDAQKWFFRAYDQDYGLQALMKYADMSKKLGDYQEAQAAYQMLAEVTNDRNRFQKYITGTTTARDWQRDAEKHFSHLKVINLTDYNTPKSEVLNQVFEANHILFSSDRDESEGRNYYAWTGRKFFDIYEAIQQNIHPFDDISVNTNEHEADGVYSADKSVFSFTRCRAEGEEYDVYCKVYVTRLGEDGRWTEPEILPFTQPGINFLHPFLTPDGRRLYFASDIDKNARGYDLFYTEWDGEEWKDPEILNTSDINTEYDELYPTIYRDTLFFSSDRPGGMGGLDIYKTYEVNGRYVPPQNLLPPVNSSYDDFKYIPFEPLRKDVRATAYFTSNRQGGAGGDDLYLFRHEIPDTEILDIAEEEEEEYITVLRFRTVTRREDPGTKQMVRFPLEGVELELKGSRDTSMISGMNGEAEVKHFDMNPVSISFRKTGYFNYNEELSPTRLSGPDTVGEEIIYRYDRLMDPIVTEEEIVLENIYYDYDRWNIRPDARPVLDSLAFLLQDNPEIHRIELTSHTDCRGTDEYNMDLSQKRAESAVEYLIQAGVKADRLTARGYGESRPVVDCECDDCTEEEHQANRRTAFKILE